MRLVYESWEAEKNDLNCIELNWPPKFSHWLPKSSFVFIDLLEIQCYPWGSILTTSGNSVLVLDGIAYSPRSFALRQAMSSATLRKSDPKIKIPWRKRKRADKTSGQAQEGDVIAQLYSNGTGETFWFPLTHSGIIPVDQSPSIAFPMVTLTAPQWCSDRRWKRCLIVKRMYLCVFPDSTHSVVEVWSTFHHYERSIQRTWDVNDKDDFISHGFIVCYGIVYTLDSLCLVWLICVWQNLSAIYPWSETWWGAGYSSLSIFAWVNLSLFP